MQNTFEHIVERNNAIITWLRELNACGGCLDNLHSRGVLNIGHTGPVLAGEGPNGRPGREAPLSSGVITSSCSVNCVITFLMKIF